MQTTNPALKKVSNFKHAITAALLLIVMSTALAACGTTAATSTSTPTTQAPPAAVDNTAVPNTPVSDNSAAPPSAATKAANLVGVTLSEWAITPNNLAIPSGKVEFKVSNTGKFGHNLSISKDGTEIGKTSTFTSGEGTQTLAVDLQPGTYEILCNVPGHADKGMKGTLTVK